jgi:tRNA (guanosine-2'-O-)-methyltransferase
MAVPNSPHYRRALEKGDTLVRRPHVHWITVPKTVWVERERRRGSAIVAVELAEDATPLTRLGPATRRTVVLLGHEHGGVPDEVGRLNVAVAGSLVLYRLAGLS